MAEKLMIHKITPSVDYNYWLKNFDTQLIEPTNKNLIKVPKVLEQTNKKTLSKNSPPASNLFTISTKFYK